MKPSSAAMPASTHVFAMTRSHLQTLEARFPEYSDKFHLVREFAGIPEKGGDIDVPDPIGMGSGAYEEVARVFETAIPAILAYIDQTSGDEG